MSEYAALAASCLDKVMAYEADSDWKPYKSSKHAQVFTKPSPDFNGTLHKTTYNIEASPEKCLDLIYDNAKHAKFDRSIKDQTTLKQIGDGMNIVRSLTPSMMAGLISSRDFIDLICFKRIPEKNVIVVYYVSVEHPDYPETKGAVRGVTYPSAVFLYNVDGNPNKTRGVNITQFEGHLSPKSLVEKFIPGTQLDFVEDLAKGVTQL
ncbi:stAR-related lipid transfer protein 6-like [Saccoglossus kowalevskii]|uniref:StAR-related lipid transfer protein 6-like n=1 Tax=Saccoglossus kowalevskii TaxID=10224 RepID=A0ABM0GR11_SACKO|nr:PREDICTED: stAR-related lipid transfer protein 6-like [Saccoglossus kowalevskii]